MSDGIKRMYEDMEMEQWERDKKKFTAVPSSTRLVNIQEALDHLKRYNDADPPMTRSQRYHVDEAIRLLKETLG